ncbi:hypothetical protein D3C86_1658470 [compost metagenome]
MRAGYATPSFFLAFVFQKKIPGAYSSGFSPPVCYQPSLARIYSLLRNDPSSRSPSVRLSLSVIPLLPCPRLRQGDYETSLIHLHLLFHPDPNHVDESYRSFPFGCFPVRYTISYRLPCFLGGSPSIAATSGSPHSGLDFACRPFGFPLTKDTLPILTLLD